MSHNQVHTTSSEETTLTSRGYRLLSKLGEGSYAKVYLGEFRTSPQSKTVSKLACKIIDTTTGPKEFVNKFLPRELKILVAIDHPHIVHIHSIFQRRHKYFIFMRFAERGDLLDYILKNGPIVENQARIWSRQLALAMQYLTELNIVHRDLKCENILVTNNKNIKLSDFGFARYTVDQKRRNILSETYCGSISYASPEILKGNPYNPKISDMWSYGVIIYVMLNKAMPFDDHHVRTLLENQMKKRWMFRGRVIEILSDEVKSLIKKLLEPEPYKRLRIEDVLHSTWFIMDSSLKVMKPNEVSALSTAIEKSKNISISSDQTKKPTSPTHSQRLSKPTTPTVASTEPAIHLIKGYDNKVTHGSSLVNRTSINEPQSPNIAENK